MITDQQVVLLRQKLMEGKTQQGAAASAAMSERSARKWAGWSAAVGEEEGQAKMEKQTGPVRGRVGE